MHILATLGLIVLILTKITIWFIISSYNVDYSYTLTEYDVYTPQLTENHHKNLCTVPCIIIIKKKIAMYHSQERQINLIYG